MTDSARIDLYVHPASSTERVAWDEWRERWEVWCRAPAVGGRANARVLELVATWLRVPPATVRFTRAGAGRRKQVEILGLGPKETALRLRRAAGTPP